MVCLCFNKVLSKHSTSVYCLKRELLSFSFFYSLGIGMLIYYFLFVYLLNVSSLVLSRYQVLFIKILQIFVCLY